MNHYRDIAIPVELLDQVTPPGGRRIGLVVGIDDYADPRIPDLKAAAADARAMHALMVDPSCGLFDSDRTALLVNSRATEREIKRELARLAQEATPDDEVWIYFAGHGLVQDGEHRLVPADCEHRFMDATSLPFHLMARKIRCRRKIVFLDCCHSGATDASTRDIHSVESLLRNYDETGAITYCASDGHEKSVELTDVGRGAFSYWLERGLRGEADADQDGVVTSTELWEFVRSHVEREAIKRTGTRQTPRVKLDATGAFALSVSSDGIARMRRRRVEIEQQMTILREFLGEGELELSTGELRASRQVLESTQPADAPRADRIRKALSLFQRDADRMVTLDLLRAAISTGPRQTDRAHALESLAQEPHHGPARAAPNAATEPTQPEAPLEASPAVDSGAAGTSEISSIAIWLTISVLGFLSGGCALILGMMFWIWPAEPENVLGMRLYILILFALASSAVLALGPVARKFGYRIGWRRKPGVFTILSSTVIGILAGMLIVGMTFDATAGLIAAPLISLSPFLRAIRIRRAQGEPSSRG